MAPSRLLTVVDRSGQGCFAGVDQSSGGLISLHIRTISCLHRNFGQGAGNGSRQGVATREGRRKVAGSADVALPPKHDGHPSPAHEYPEHGRRTFRHLMQPGAQELVRRKRPTMPIVKDLPPTAQGVPGTYHWRPFNQQPIAPRMGRTSAILYAGPMHKFLQARASLSRKSTHADIA